MRNNINIEKLITIDSTGMPKAPSVRQLQDKDIILMYARDKSSDKKRYLAEIGVVYYLGDPQSPANQKGLNRREALKEAIENYNLPKDYKPDIITNRVIDKYYHSNITEAGVALETLLKSVHLVALSATKINDLLNEKLNEAISPDDVSNILSLIDAVSKRAVEIPALTKSLKLAYDNLRDEKEEQIGRGNQIITSSMDADDN